MTEAFLSAAELGRYTQQIKLPEIGLVGQQRLKQASVLCLGLGGLGSPLALYLAAAGIGTLGLVDDDQIELSNLQRQILYRSAQLGQAKVLAAKEELLTLNPFLELRVHQEKFTQENAEHLIADYDLVVDGTDNFYTRYLCHDVCFSLAKPYIYASATGFQGHCSVFAGPEGPCLRCLFPATAKMSTMANCNSGGVLAMVPGILGLMQATEVIKELLGLGQSLRKRLVLIDALNMRVKEVQLLQNPDCPLCVGKQPWQRLNSPAKSLSCRILENYAISAEQLIAFLRQHPQASLIDVRSAKEHARENLGGSLVPLTELLTRLTELNPQAPIILYCTSGKRSLEALNLLLAAGFTELKYLKGGIESVPSGLRYDCAASILPDRERDSSDRLNKAEDSEASDV